MSRSKKDKRGGHAHTDAYWPHRVRGGAVIRDTWNEVRSGGGKRYVKRLLHRLIRRQKIKTDEE